MNKIPNCLYFKRLCRKRLRNTGFQRDATTPKVENDKIDTCFDKDDYQIAFKIRHARDLCYNYTHFQPMQLDVKALAHTVSCMGAQIDWWGDGNTVSDNTGKNI